MELENFYRGKKVLISGHTGVKGSWLATWLDMMGANVSGVALEPQTNPSHYQACEMNFKSHFVNIQNLEKLREAFQIEKPEIVFHLAAQSLVRYSYDNPVETYATNVMGTMNVLESSRACESIRSLVCVTTDKCYENKNWIWGYRESDPMGGYDPYSSSKGCAELLVASYRNSYFNNDDYNKKHQILCATTRSGNILAGGDWSQDRLVPDLMRTASNKDSVEIRSADATRPWQHVLDPLRGYLELGKRLYEGDKVCATSFNFGPEDSSNVSVKKIIELSQAYWPDIKVKYLENKNHPHEARLLKLDCSKAKAILDWGPCIPLEKTVSLTIDWYKNYYLEKKIITHQQIKQFMKDAF